MPDGSGSSVALAELENGSVAFGEGRSLGRAEGEVKGRFAVLGSGLGVQGLGCLVLGLADRNCI